MKVAVLVSGGVDSSVALKLLQEQGYAVTAFYLKIWLEDELSYLGTCPWQEDLAYVQAVCDQLAVPLEIISLQKEYHEQVVAYTIAQVKSGRTPNPDIMCNQRIKFGAFYKAISDEYDFVATGHYAQKIVEPDGTATLAMAPDAIKDQTYFLSHLSQAQLSRALFPLGHLQKSQVRALAQQYNLPNKERKDSQGICFLGKLKFSDFIKHHVGEREGAIIEYETGLLLGKHKGFWYYTIGQRQGLRLAGGPWYVVAKDVKNNTVYASKNYYDPEKTRNSFCVSDCNWLNKLPEKQDLQVKLRHGATLYRCSLTPIDEKSFRVTLDAQDQGIASGQFAVFYDGAVCLGGGVIV